MCSIACMYTHTAIEHINHVHQERESREREIAALKQEIKELNAAIARCQEQLPASGAPITRQVCPLPTPVVRGSHADPCLLLYCVEI